METALSTVGRSPGKKQGLQIDRSAISKLPYATIKAKLGKGLPAILVLSRYDGGDLHWMSANRVLLVTRFGRLVKTVGLDENLSQVILPEGDPIAQSPHEMQAPTSFAMDYDLRRGTIESLSVSSTIEPLGKQRITIAELEFETILIREKNRAHPIKWTFENRYWVDAYDGFVWKSHQHITPNLPPVQIEVLKPAA